MIEHLNSKTGKGFKPSAAGAENIDHRYSEGHRLEDFIQVIDVKAEHWMGDSTMENKCFCTHECFITNNIIFNPRMLPRILKEYIKLKLR